MKTKSQQSLRKGMRVEVFQKPITKEQKEGHATLHRFEGMGHESYFPQGEDGPERILALWSVRFDGDNHVVDRWVSPSDVMEGK